MSAISAWHNRKGFGSPTSRNPILKLVLKGAKRVHAYNTGSQSRRQPITLKVLQTLLCLLRSSNCHLNQCDKRMLRAALTLAFYGLLCISEFMVPSKRAFDPRRHATMADISWGSQHYTLTVKYCKTDQLGHGHKLYIPKARGIACPFQAMHRYCSHISKKGTHADTCTPLFRFKSGEPLTRSNFLTHLQNSSHKPAIPHMHLTHTVSGSVQPPQLQKLGYLHPRSSCWDAGAVQLTVAIPAHTITLSELQPTAWPVLYCTTLLNTLRICSFIHDLLFTHDPLYEGSKTVMMYQILNFHLRTAFWGVSLWAAIPGGLSYQKA